MHNAEATATAVLNAMVDPNAVGRRVAVVGLGFVGLPLALSFAMRGATVVGVDLSSRRVADIRSGQPHDAEEYQGLSLPTILAHQVAAQRFTVQENHSGLDQAEAIVITVGLPVVDGKPTTAYLESACRDVGSRLRRGQIVIVRSTVIPGTTEGLLKPILEEMSGLRAGVDFHLAYASERIAEGRAFEEFENMPLLLGGITPTCMQVGADILGIVTRAPIHHGSSLATIEMTKVIENVQRDVNIAMVQQFARLCEAMSLNVYEVIRLANTHKRVNLLMPGPGVGGFCIPNAYYYLEPKAEELAVNLDLLRLARSINDHIPDLVVQMTRAALEAHGLNLSDAKIAVLGLAMKDFSSDDRISPATDICEKLLGARARVAAFDSLVPTPRSYRVGTLEEALAGANLILLLANQPGASLADIARYRESMAGKVLFDTRNCMDEAEAARLGLQVVRL